jgi:prephenate dehydrogenase
MAEDKRKITIIGLGLIGGSLGLALKAAGLNGVEIVGHDRDHGTENQAKRIGAIDRGEHNLPRAVEGASMVIIATPVLAVREIMEQIAPELSEGSIVTDTASTKADVMRWAKELLPRQVSFVGGHPMAGKENSGIEAAEAGLFRDKAYCVCPSVTASESAVKAVLGLAKAVGSEPLFIDPAEHDQYAAAISHLPLVMSTALFSLTRASPSWEDMAQLASSGFRDATRLASTDPTMSHDIWTTNREALIHWLERMEGELSRFRKLLEDANDAELLDIFARTRLERDRFILEPPRREAATMAPGAGASRNVLVDMLVGGMIGERLRQAEKDVRASEKGEAPLREEEEEEDKPRKPTFGERVAEGVRRDLERMERERGGKGNADDAGS